MKRSIRFCGHIAGVVIVVSTISFGVAAAEQAIGFDLDYAVPINSDPVSPGWGMGIRLGSQVHVPLVVVTPEVGFTYHTFGGTSPNVYRGLGGVRVGIGEIIRPGVFGHIGYGAFRSDVGGSRDTSFSFTYDLGACLEFTLLPVLNLGVHTAYNKWTGGDNPPFSFATVGAHAVLVF